MKTIGEQAKEFREAKGWNSTRMAKEVGTSRQNIESLELRGNRKPHYIVDLARVMGTTVDGLMMGAQSGVTPPEYKPNQPLAHMQQAPAAINGVASLEQSLNGLAAYLMHADATTRTAAGALLAALAQQPDHPAVMASLTTLLAPAAFTQREQKRA